MTEEIKRIDIKEFRAKGFLQEANRLFFHPLGLALEVIIDDDTGKESLGGIWDYREDPEGMFYGNNLLDEQKIKYVEQLKNSKRVPRLLYSREEDFIINKDSVQIPHYKKLQELKELEKQSKLKLEALIEEKEGHGKK